MTTAADAAATVVAVVEEDDAAAAGIDPIYLDHNKPARTARVFIILLRHDTLPAVASVVHHESDPQGDPVLLDLVPFHNHFLVLDPCLAYVLYGLGGLRDPLLQGIVETLRGTGTYFYYLRYGHR
jgi:hypothetical protein